MTNPPPLGYQSYQHQDDSAFLSKWGKRLLILWLTLVTTVIAAGFLIFLLVGGCTLKVLSDASAEISRTNNNPSSAQTTTTEVEMARHREKIEQRLDAGQHQVPPKLRETNVNLDQLGKPIAAGAETLAKGIAEWDMENAKSAVREAKRKHDERVRTSYQGFPGHYDSRK